MRSAPTADSLRFRRACQALDGRARARARQSIRDRRLTGAIAAASRRSATAVTRLDDDAFGPYADFLVGAGPRRGARVRDERRGGAALGRRAAARARALARERSRGASSSPRTAAPRRPRTRWRSRRTRAESGADAVAVIGPPYFKLDPRAQRGPPARRGAGRARPLPFYVYEFAATAGYAFDPSMLARLREEADNVAGMKVSDTPWDAFERYLLDGFDIFVGPEALIHRGREAGAVGAVSALASAFPEEVAAVVREPTEAGAAGLAALRERMSSRSPATPRSSGWSAGRACRFVRTCALRCATSTPRRSPRSRRGSTSRGRSAARRERRGHGRTRCSARGSCARPTTATSRRFMGRYGMRLGAARFVAGETLDECVAVLRRLADQGLHTNTTLLGESVRDRAEAEAVADEYGRDPRAAPRGAAAVQRRAQADASRPRARRGARVRERRARRRDRRAARELRPDRHGAVERASTRRSASIAGCARPGTTGSAPCSSRTSSAPSPTSSRCCRSRRTSAS